MEWSLIFLMFTSRPSPMEWSLIFLCLLKALSDGMVIDLLMFTSRPSPMEWSLIFFLHIKTLSNGMVIDFFVIARPSPMERSFISFLTSGPSPSKWSSFFSSLDPDPLLRIGHHIPLNHFFSHPFLVQNPDEISVSIFTYLLP